MDEHLIITGGRTYRIPAGDEDMDAALAWWVESRGEAASIAALSRQQVFARIRRAAIPAGFPEPDVVIGDTDRDSGGFIRLAARDSAGLARRARPGRQRDY